ncbi:hypothetical protein EYV94_04435 [Puteibacter caeruleilacunae]|nr:hypothetical protein EYV94_04435 [Puteibacter caeruleilacunae]
MKFSNHSLILVLILLVTGCAQKQTTPEDWPQYKNDNYRSGNSAIDLNVESLGLSWIYKASQVPAPAWYGPAKEDAYAVSGPLPSMRDYDLAYYPIVVGKNLYYSSTADDAVHCLRSSDGTKKWRFTTNGPVRIAPVFHNGNLYFGSDDGYVYCISASNGKLKWKYSPTASEEKRLLNNGRMISFWPVRTGVLIEDGKAYFGASLLPWEKSYFCAVNIETGLPEGAGSFVKVLDNMTLEGAMASTGKMLIQPQGRIAPVFFDKQSGNKKGSLPGTGGCFVLVTPDKHIIHPQTSRYKSIKEYVDKEEPEYMSFKGGKEMVIKGDTSFIITDNSLSAYNRSTKKLLWLRRGYQAHRLIASGNSLFVGATDTVYAVSPKNGLPLWKAPVHGTVKALITAQGALFTSTVEGEIRCFKPGNGKHELWVKNVNKPGIIEEKPAKEKDVEIEDKLMLAAGPFVEALWVDSVRLSFETSQSEVVAVNWNAGSYTNNKEVKSTGIKHDLVLPVRKDFQYNYSIKNSKGAQADFEYDNFFNYQVKKFNFDGISSNAEDQRHLLDLFKNAEGTKGLVLVVGLSDEELPEIIASNTAYDVIVLDSSKSRVEDCREKWQEAEVYGRKLSVQWVEDINKLPITSELATVVVVNEKVKADEAIRLLAPRGILISDGGKLLDLKNSNLNWQVKELTDNNNVKCIQKLPLEIAGNWTHQYASADNSAYGGESFWGASKTEDYEIQWMGRPGPRFQTDRSGRKPSPLAVHGRMFVQGNERIVAVDVYNGEILWSKDVVGFKRMNIHRDCSNWAANEESLFLVVDNNLVIIDQLTGKINSIVPVENADWGYIATTKNQIIGSIIPQGAAYKNYYGGGSSGWYDAQTGGNTQKVMSTDICARTLDGKSENWRYSPKGHIINATITIYQDKIFFVEADGSRLSEMNRGGDDIFKRISLVALDIKSGEKIYKKRIKNKPGISMYSMAAGNDRLVIVSSHKGEYGIYGYESNSGKLVWEKEQKWFHGDHGGHLSRPAIVNNRLIVKPEMYNVSTGKELDFNVPKSGHGCASYALTEQAIFYRGGSVTQFNFDTREFSRWERLRPDCWISTIPAQGMVLSPEAGGGCSCGNWLETSMVMAPVSRAPILFNNMSEDKPDFTEETYGKYNQPRFANEFTNSMTVSIQVKPGVEGVVRYTVDGSSPTMNSKEYKEPITIEESTNVKAALFIEKKGKVRKMERTSNYIKLLKASE